MQGLTLPENTTHMAVAVSGGADSMALAHMLSQLGINVHALTVDHGLRPESATEAALVSQYLSTLPQVKHTILRWEGDKPSAGIMANARSARYALMADYCNTHKIKYLALAHHHDDQAETFFMRLSRGSGIDGLASMRVFQVYDDNLTLWRPLLENTSHAELVAYCQTNGMNWVEDPSNQNTKYTRVRLRDALKDEGLDARRMSTSLRRIERASDALRVLAGRLAQKAQIEKNDARVVYGLDLLRREPFELALRVIRAAIDDMGNGNEYGARFDRVEEVAALCLDGHSHTLTLGGCVLRANTRRGTLSVCREEAPKSAKSLPFVANGL